MSTAAITVLRPVDEIERLWQSEDMRPAGYESEDSRVRFRRAPGDRGTEISITIATTPAGSLGKIAQKVKSANPRAKAMDDLRQFKQLVETGVITRSEAAPEGERAGRKLKQRPAQPLQPKEAEEVGV